MSDDLFRILTVGVPLLSVVVVLVALVRARKVNERTTELLKGANTERGRIAEAVESWASLERKIGEFQLRYLEAVEEASERAELDVTLENMGAGRRIVIRNNGDAPAYNVNLIFDTPGKDSPLVDHEDTLPIEKLNPGKHRPFLAALASRRWPPFNYVLTWQDPSGDERHVDGEMFEE